jgi:hypothetical protein
VLCCCDGVQRPPRLGDGTRLSATKVGAGTQAQHFETAECRHPIWPYSTAPTLHGVDCAILPVALRAKGRQAMDKSVVPGASSSVYKVVVVRLL